MLTPHSSLPANTRVWIYPASRTLTPAECEAINATLTSFCQEWSAHGAPLQSNFEIRNNRFVILLVDEAKHAASGCSIDGSTRVMKGIAQALGVDFFDRGNVPLLQNGTLEIWPANEFKAKVKSGEISGHEIILHTLAATKEELDQYWHLPIEKSWLAKYLPQQAVI